MTPSSTQTPINPATKKQITPAMLQSVLGFDRQEYLDFKVSLQLVLLTIKLLVRDLMRRCGVDFKKSASTQHPPVMSKLYHKVLSISKLLSLTIDYEVVPNLQRAHLRQRYHEDYRRHYSRLSSKQEPFKRSNGAKRKTKKTSEHYSLEQLDEWRR